MENLQPTNKLLQPIRESKVKPWLAQKPFQRVEYQEKPAAGMADGNTEKDTEGQCGCFFGSFFEIVKISHQMSHLKMVILLTGVIGTLSLVKVMQNLHH